MILRRGVILGLVSFGNLLLWIDYWSHPWGMEISAVTFYSLAFIYAQLTKPRNM